MSHARRVIRVKLTKIWMGLISGSFDCSGYSVCAAAITSGFVELVIKWYIVIKNHVGV